MCVSGTKIYGKASSATLISLLDGVLFRDPQNSAGKEVLLQYKCGRNKTHTECEFFPEILVAIF
jgi:hypothetical protein